MKQQAGQTGVSVSAINAVVDMARLVVLLGCVLISASLVMHLLHLWPAVDEGLTIAAIILCASGLLTICLVRMGLNFGLRVTRGTPPVDYNELRAIMEKYSMGRPSDTDSAQQGSIVNSETNQFTDQD